MPMPDRVEVHYVGPNHQGDPRTLMVSTQEAKDLEATGLWSKSGPAIPKAVSKTTKEKEVKANA